MDFCNYRVPFIQEDKIISIADEFRNIYADEIIFPIDMENIIEFKLKLEIIPLSNIRPLINSDAFILSDFQSIILDSDYFNDHRYENRIRFSLAHEIGHFVLHRKQYDDFTISSIEDYINYVTNISGQSYKAFEWQANCFAANLLAPINELNLFMKDEILPILDKEGLLYLLKKDKNQLISIISPSIEKYFGVSDEVIERRLKEKYIWPEV